MKKLLLIIILNSIALQAQNNSEEINILEKNKKNISEKIISLNDSIGKIDLRINNLKSKEILKQFKDTSFVAIANKNFKLRKNPEPMGDILLTLSEDTKVLILDYYNGYFGVCINAFCGYVSDVWIQRSPKINELIKVKDAEREAFERLKHETEMKKDKIEYAEIEKQNLKKYGKVIYDKLKKGSYWIGMTDDMAMISLGYPNDINRSVGSWGVNEQWVYDGKYLYFENGKMSSYQN
jgi:predicted nuclease with TOPRIM domain